MPQHLCHAHLCREEVPPRMFMCRAHWAKVPPDLQKAIWREYQAGQENTKLPSARYMAVTFLAIARVVFVPRDERAALDAANYMIRARRWRHRAMDLGKGDPLEAFLPKEEKESTT